MGRTRALLLVGSLTAALSCVEGEVDRIVYEVGESGTLFLANPSPFPAAIGGCNPMYFEERVIGMWVPDGFLRPACVFGTATDGSHTLDRYQIIPPRGTLAVHFGIYPADAFPAVRRIRHRVSTGCDRPLRDGAPITCRGVESVLTDPFVVLEPGTKDVIGRRGPG